MMTSAEIVPALLGICFGAVCMWGILQHRQIRFHKRIAELEAMHGNEAIMQQQFRQLADAVFTEKNKVASMQLDAVINPLKDEIRNFQNKVNEHVKEQIALKTEIAHITTVSREMTIQTKELATALKGDVKTQGNWGEVMLERILTASGLVQGTDYAVQKTVAHTNGGYGRPDVIVYLPENKHIVIDAKVALTHYTAYCAAQTNTAAQQQARLQLCRSIKAHIEGLAARRYQDSDAIDTPDFVLLFLPVEGAYALALQTEPELHDFAWKKSIVLVGPTTLFATLKTIASLWRIEKQNKNAQDIAARSGRLHDKFVGFITDMEKIGSHIDNSKDTFDAAMRKLHTGSGNLVKQVEQLKTLGARAEKSLPEHLT